MNDELRDPTANPAEDDDVLEDAQQKETAAKELDTDTENSDDEG